MLRGAHSIRLGIFGPFALVNAGAILTHDDEIDVIDMLWLQMHHVAEFRQRPHRTDLAEQIEPLAQLVHEPAATGAVQQGSAAGKYIAAEFVCFSGKRSAMLCLGIVANGSAVTDAERPGADRFQSVEHLETNANHFRPAAFSVKHSNYVHAVIRRRRWQTALQHSPQRELER